MEEGRLTIMKFYCPKCEFITEHLFYLQYETKRYFLFKIICLNESCEHSSENKFRKIGGR
jgi:hypothetical protein